MKNSSKKLFTSSILIIAVLAIGVAIGRWWSAHDAGNQENSQQAMQQETSSKKESEREILYWKAPMDANYRRDKAGKSPMGMDLVPVYAKAPPKKESEREILYWKAPMDANYRRDKPGKSPMGMDLVPVYAKPVSKTGMQEDPSVVSIEPSVINKLGVRSEAVKQSALPSEIDTVASVMYDEDSTYQVNTRVAGWVENLAVKSVGDSINKGQLLFELYSPELVNAQQEYLSALKSKSNILHKASAQRLAALGISSREIKRLAKDRTVKQRVRVTAKADGVVTQLGIREGARIMPATQVMSIASLQNIWVVAEIFESQSAWLEQGQVANVTLDSLPGKIFSGTLDYIYPELDPITRTVKVRLRFDNQDEFFRPNMFARVTIIGSDTQPVIHVASAALIRGGRLNRVVLDLGDGQFKAQEVIPGREVKGRVEIISGLSQGDRVVTSGQFLIDSESNIESALGRMDMTKDDSAEPDMEMQQ